MGNSIGAFSALLAASLGPELCNGLVLLNAAGRFEECQPGEGPARKQAGDLVAEAEEPGQGPLQWALQQVRRGPSQLGVLHHEAADPVDLAVGLRQPAAGPLKSSSPGFQGFPFKNSVVRNPKRLLPSIIFASPSNHAFYDLQTRHSITVYHPFWRHPHLQPGLDPNASGGLYISAVAPFSDSLGPTLRAFELC